MKRLAAAAAVLLSASPATADPLWFTTWEGPPFEDKPGSVGAILQAGRARTDVDVRSITESKGITYFTFRVYLPTKNDAICKVDQRVCEGVGSAVNCVNNTGYRNGTWLPLAKGKWGEGFINSAKFVCKY